MFGTIIATSRVIYDKGLEYVTPESSSINKKEVSENEEDCLSNYDKLIKITKYEDENKSKRILKEVGLYEEYGYFFSDPSHVVDNIYLGSAQNASNYDTLKKYDIGLIMNVTKEISEWFPKDFKYVRYDLKDNNEHSISEYLDQAYNDIIEYQKNHHGNILIHCFMGRSRSASVVLYYLMKTKKNEDGTSFTFDDALEFLKEKRPIVNPTFRFAKDLAKSLISYK